MRSPLPAIRPLLALAAPLLILLAMISLLARHGSQRLQAVPALVIGSGLMVTSRLRRSRRRRRLVEALRGQPLASPPPHPNPPVSMGG
ncbi:MULTISPECIES: DUF3188 domain-containing protein [Synechococcaceae]|uniref:DUF3188 domain-containing protein n=1 Tax=Synechococcaceae TaxID=1890426 RepID=UPI0008FF2B75|nr:MULTISPECIES: DUF3188 domain-containing protein [Synechococcaceae]APD48162.1 hypothetical protein BM449_07795 [Synechococcus sp. SynAce01]TWB93833.1 uncharacterized protein DUF3188 [Synechococcus sp. Ace-Pa]